MDEKNNVHETHLEDLDLEKHHYGHHDPHDHIGNDRAFKGDDSDGKVNWSIKTVLACLTLGMLYTGNPPIIETPHGIDLHPQQAHRLCSTWSVAC
jgi:hypothetical protein